MEYVWHVEMEVKGTLVEAQLALLIMNAHLALALIYNALLVLR